MADRKSFKYGAWKSGIEIAADVATALALLGLVFTARLTYQANQTAQEALELNRRSSEQEVALKFYIGGVPADQPEDETIAEQAVINASTVDMYEVVVIGTETEESLQSEAGKREPLTRDPLALPESKRIDLTPFQACTGYTLPKNFDVDEVHFFDGSNYWLRSKDGNLQKEDKPQLSNIKEFPISDDVPSKSGKKAPYHMALKYCS